MSGEDCALIGEPFSKGPGTARVGLGQDRA